MEINYNYSPNFDLKKRKTKQIKFIIFHYTGMKKENEAIKKLTDSKSKVSCHYFIKKNGEILNLVPDLYVAWHAGVSNWKSYKSINKNSIGIEISNSGHEFKYKKFTQKQIRSVLKVSRYLIKKYKIKSKFILGHSDIAPDRKIDPGEKFPWKFLYKRKVGCWHNINKKILIKERNQILSKVEKNIFFKNLSLIGYSQNLIRKKNKYSKILISAFQRRFRQELVDGVIDKECLIISQKLAKKFK